MDVVMVRWPGERDRLIELRRFGAPRLVLVAADVSAPEAEPDPGLEDWIRLPAPADDVRVRVAGLVARAARTQRLRPTISGDGVTFGGRLVALAPTEQRVLTCLVEGWGTVVSRRVLHQSVWPGQGPRRNALDLAVSRLRRRVDQLGLDIRTVRSRGYQLGEGLSGLALSGPAFSEH